MTSAWPKYWHITICMAAIFKMDATAHIVVCRMASISDTFCIGMIKMCAKFHSFKTKCTVFFANQLDYNTACIQTLSSEQHIWKTPILSTKVIIPFGISCVQTLDKNIEDKSRYCSRPIKKLINCAVWPEMLRWVKINQTVRILKVIHPLSR